MKKKNKILISIALVIIIAGIIVTCLFGFNKELRYKELQNIEIYAEQQIDLDQIKQITNEVLGNKNSVQVIEIYNDMVVIKAETISEDQKNEIVNKVKEKYEFSQTAEDTTIDTIVATKFIDMYKKYILPCVISTVIISAYMIIKYRKNGIVKMLTQIILIPVIVELLLLSLIAILRIPVGRTTPIIAILAYIMSIVYIEYKNQIK